MISPPLPFRKKVAYAVSFLSVLALFFLLNLIPFRYLHTAAAFFTTIILRVYPKARKRIEDNIAFALPELQGSDREIFFKKNIQNSIRTFIEIFHTWKMKKKSFRDRYISIDSFDSIILLKKRRQGIVAVQGHFGNWEIALTYYTHNGIPLTYSAKHLRNPYVDRFIAWLRKGYGGTIVYLKQPLRLMKDLKRGHVIGLAADQDAGKNGIFVNFFNKKASTYAGPAALSYLGNVDLVLVTCIFQGAGKYQIQYKSVHDRFSNGQYQGYDEAVYDITNKWAMTLEQEVRKNPDQYLWLHRRWKTRP